MKNVKLGEVNGYECYILKNNEDLIENEKNAFSNFYKAVEHDRWVGSNYQVIDNYRLKCPFSHFHQITFVLKDANNNIVAGAACNLNMIEKLQLEMIGFSIDVFKENYSFVEGLYYYSYLGDNPLKQLSILLKWNKLMFNYLKEEKGRQIFFGTCPERLIKFWKLLNQEPHDSIDIGYSDRYWLFKHYL